MKILFIGNSHTYCHAVPYQCRELLASIGIESQVSMVAQPGKSLAWHKKNPTSKIALQYGDWDNIILQQASHPFGGTEELLNSVKNLLDLITGKPKVWLYKTWCEKAKPENQSYIDDAFKAVSEKLSLPIIPISEAWHTIEERNPGHELYDNDGCHSGPSGSYVAGLCIARALSGKSVVGLPSTLSCQQQIINQVSPSNAAFYQDVVNEVISIT